MATANNHVILLVDDEEAITRSLRRLFRKEGYLILSAPSGAVGLDMLDRLDYPVSLIISDQRMPEMSGAEFLARSREKAPDAIRFLLTGYSDMNAVIEAVNQGEIHRYLTKPWNDGELVAQVRQGLAHVDLIRENKRLDLLARKQNKELQTLNRNLEKRVDERTNALHAKSLQLESHLKNTVRVLTSLVETLNPGLGRYMQRTARLARRVGSEFDMAPATLEQLEIAGLVHDIGLLGFSDDVLHINEDRLKGDDFKRFSQHPVIAAISFEALDSLSGVGEIILHHHEWINGNGFPNGLKKKDIPPGIADPWRRLHLLPHCGDLAQRAKRAVPAGSGVPGGIPAPGCPLRRSRGHAPGNRPADPAQRREPEIRCRSGQGIARNHRQSGDVRRKPESGNGFLWTNSDRA